MREPGRQSLRNSAGSISNTCHSRQGSNCSTKDEQPKEEATDRTDEQTSEIISLSLSLRLDVPVFSFSLLRVRLGLVGASILSEHPSSDGPLFGGMKLVSRLCLIGECHRLACGDMGHDFLSGVPPARVLIENIPGFYSHSYQPSTNFSVNAVPGGAGENPDRCSRSLLE